MRTRLLIALALLAVLCSACTTPAHDPRDKEGKVAVHIALPADGIFQTSGEFSSEELAKDDSTIGHGLSVVFEWGEEESRSLAGSSRIFGFRGYNIESKDDAGEVVSGSALEFAFGYRAYPDLGVDNPMFQPFVGADFLFLPFVDVGEVDFLALGVSFNIGANLWVNDHAAFEIQSRFIGTIEDLLDSPRFQRGYVIEAGIVIWL